MLGLRHYQGTAIDLFQGDISDFVCNAMVIDFKLAASLEKEIVTAWQRCGPGTQPRVLPITPPLWQSGDEIDAKALHYAYRQSFLQAADLNFLHLALPLIAKDAEVHSLEKAATIAMSACKEFCQQHPNKLRRISFVLGETKVYQAYQKALFAGFPELEGN